VNRRNRPRPGGTSLSRRHLRKFELPPNVKYLPTDRTGFSSYGIRLADFESPPKDDEKPSNDS
jgi:hypothetical protein